MALDVKYPYMLLLALPVLILMLLFFKKTSPLGKSDRTIIGTIRTFVLLLIVAALSVPQILLPSNGETVIFLVDRSKSASEAEDFVLDFIDSGASSIGNKSFAVASFANGAVSELSTTKSKTSLRQFSSKLDSGETNIEAGLQFASSLAGMEQGTRIVLMTDGNETAGDAASAARLLANRNLELDIVPLSRNENKDMAITKLDVPPSLYEGEKASISVTVASNFSANTAIRISVNNQDILQEKVHVNEGDNVFTFKDTAPGPGMAVYKAVLISNGDAYIENNSLQAVSNVKGTPKVLVVQGTEDTRLPGILESSGLIVDTVVPEKLPTAMTGYLQYQSIVFNNVPATKVTENQMKLIEKAVSEFGTGFVMAGGEDSFGLGGYFKTPIEKLLPVDMDIKGKKELPSLGLIIVIDRSGSMSGNKFSLAKEAAARSVDLLREEDTLGFIAFDDRPWVIVEAAPLKNKKKVIEKIRSVTVGGGTNIFPSLERAYEELDQLKLQRKHIILLTDGQSAAGGDYDALIAKGKEENITLSTVALGHDADRVLLEGLASKGSGRFYDVIDASVIPSILSRETVMTTRTYIEDEPFYPIIEPYPDWEPLFKNGVPRMNAYIAVTPKSRAEIPLLSEKQDPILAQWHYGLGSTLAFTSDLTGKWSGDWVRWGNWPNFVNGLVSKSLPQYSSEPFGVSVGKSDGNTVVSLTKSTSGALPLEASIVSQEGKMIDSNTKLVSPGAYDLVFPNKPGMYFLMVKQTEKNGKITAYRTGFSVPYSDEYLLRGTNKTLLKELVKISGGKELVSPKEAFRPLKNKPKEIQPISSYLLLTAFLLLVVEIFIRRFGLTAVLGRVLKRRKLVSDTSGEDVFGRLSSVKEKASRRRPVNTKVTEHKLDSTQGDPQKEVREAQKLSQAKTKKKQDEPPLSPAEKEERMKRLLEAKKRGK